MTTSFTTGRYTPKCPDWCVSTIPEHERGTFVMDGGVPVVDHQGPTFGPLFTAGTEYLLQDRPLELRVHSDLPDDAEGFTLEELRELATAAAQAAEWLEAHR